MGQRSRGSSICEEEAGAVVEAGVAVRGVVLVAATRAKVAAAAVLAAVCVAATGREAEGWLGEEGRESGCHWTTKWRTCCLCVFNCLG